MLNCPESAEAYDSVHISRQSSDAQKLPSRARFSVKYALPAPHSGLIPVNVLAFSPLAAKSAASDRSRHPAACSLRSLCFVFSPLQLLEDLVMRDLTDRSGKVGYILLWLLGIPI